MGRVYFGFLGLTQITNNFSIFLYFLYFIKLQLASSANVQNSNLAPSPASQMMLNNALGNPGNSAIGSLGQYGLGGLNSANTISQQMSALNSANAQKGLGLQNSGGNMWSNFGSSKDSTLKFI